MKAFKIDKLNQLYDNASHEQGAAFVQNILKALQITVEIDPKELQHLPKEGPFIAVANHPFGLLDGLILIKTLVEVRPDAKVMGNFLLQRIEPLKELILPVNPFDDSKGSGANISGLKATLQYLRDGHPVGMFPAGEVATMQEHFTHIADREWQPSAVKLIQKAKVPVVPLFFEGSNSMSFHLLGKIHPLLRTVKIPSELVNKQRRVVRLRVGTPIQPAEQEEFESNTKFGRYLRARVETLGSALKEVKKFYRPSFRLPKKPQEIIPETHKDLIIPEIDRIKAAGQVLHSKKQFEVLYASAYQIPNILNEIGRLREITFRSIGEGTNRKIDVDEYDLYYKHLFVWDSEEEKVIGAYRLGEGKNIMAKYGYKGFYITSLFHLEPQFNAILEQALELGRSFVVKEYQQKPLPLFLLWQGILAYLIKNPEYQYLIGPVSISNIYSKLSKSFLIAFIKKFYFDHNLAKLVTARKEFQVDFEHTDSEILMERFGGDVSQLDKLIADIEPARYRVPVLLKKYMQQNAKIISFNIDPKFNDALDGLMLLNLDDLPEGTISKLRKELNIE
jgi:putative hemolysin